jgi:hypothetical protein
MRKLADPDNIAESANTRHLGSILVDYWYDKVFPYATPFLGVSSSAAGS